MGGARLTHLALGIIALALALLGAAPSAGAPAPPRLAGTRVTATADPAHAPALHTGRYVTRLPRGKPTYLRLERSAASTTLHLGGQLIGHGGSVGEGFSLDVGTTPGQGNCGSAVVFRPTVGETAPVLYAATSTWTSVADHPCTTSRSLYVEIHPPTDPADAGLPLQLRVYEEPSVDDAGFSLLTTPSPPLWSDLPTGAPRSITPGHVADTAPVVRDGTVAVRLRPGDDDFLAVPLDWGDSVRVQLDADLPSALDPARPGLELHILGPLLDNADTGGLGTDPDIGPTRSRRAYRTGVMSQPIAYVNRDTVDAAVNGADLAGIHYVALSYLPPVRTAGPLTVRLTLQVRPGDGQAPLYATAPRVYPPASDSRLVDGSLTAPVPPTAVDESQPQIVSGGTHPWQFVAVIVGGLIGVWLLVRLAAAVRHRQHRRREQDREQHQEQHGGRHRGDHHGHHGPHGGGHRG